MNAYQQKMIAEAKAKEEMENCTEEYVTDLGNIHLLRLIAHIQEYSRESAKENR